MKMRWEIHRSCIHPSKNRFQSLFLAANREIVVSLLGYNPKPKPGSALRCISRTPGIRRLAPLVSWDGIPRPPRGSRESYFSLPDS